jgi:hypothetical protein
MYDTEIDGFKIIGEGDVFFQVAKIRSAVRHSLIAFDAHSCIQLIGIAAEFLEVRMAPIFSAQRHAQRECQRRIYI